MSDEEAHIQQLLQIFLFFAFTFVPPHIPQTQTSGIKQKQGKRPWSQCGKYSDQNLCDYLGNT
jgi:hypothetical protein